MNKRSMLLMSLVSIFFCGLSQDEKKFRYNIPNEYKGVIIIFLGEPCGSDAKMLKGQREISIQGDGIAVLTIEDLDSPFDTVKINGEMTRHNPNTYYWVTRKKKSVELPELVEWKFEDEDVPKPEVDKVGVFFEGFTSGESYLPDTIRYHYCTLFVGNYSERKSSSYWIELYKKELEAIRRLRACRQP